MDKLLKSYAHEIDSATVEENVPKLEALVNRCSEELESENSRGRAIYHFFIANCYDAIASLRSREIDYAWSWMQDERVSEILSLRKSISESGFSDLDQVVKCKIITNIGNSLSQLGRFVEAIKSWDTSLSIMPNFAMALGNKGVGLIEYGHSLYDYSHTGILVAHAKAELQKAISKGAVWDSGFHPEAEEFFRKYYEYSEVHLKRIEYDFDFNLNQWSLGETQEEVNYRDWCLQHGFFLSPLNDIFRLTAAAQDVIHLPSHSYRIDEEPRFPNYFNLLKQEYIAARFMLFESINGEREHISDKDVLLIDGLDGVQFGYRSEQLKTAYRLAYSLFDKIALFLNDYFEVGLKSEAVSFRNIWGKKANKVFELYPCFEQSRNWPLRGLYYLSKDLFNEDFIDTALPEAKELADLRNRTEHRFLSLQEYAAFVKKTDIHSYITIDDFEKKALRILSMAREALIYLSLAMHQEEQVRSKSKPGSELTVPIYAMPIERNCG